MEQSNRGERISHVFVELDKILLVGGVRGRQQVPDEEDHKHELDGGSDRVVLVAGPDVSNNDGRARQFLERSGCYIRSRS